MSDQVRRRRDPEARRAAIVTAAAELITEVGVDAITHRMVAARADVPLGATTQYFSSLDELRAAALQALADHVEAQISAAKQSVVGADPRALAEFIHAALRDVQAVKAESAVVTAAVHDPVLRELAQGWVRRITDFLAEEYDDDRATAATAFIAGVLLHAQMHDEPLPLRIIESGLAGILGDPVTTAHRTA